MLKKKALTETIYNNGDPFQIRKAISAAIGAWQKQEKYQVLWETLDIFTFDYEDDLQMLDDVRSKHYSIQVEVVYDASN